MSDEVFGKAKEVLDELSADPYAQRVARLREEGLAMYRMEMGEARRQGEAAGEARGQQAVLIQQLEFRFGALSDETRETLDQASPELIRAWALRVLSASSIEEVFMVDPASHATHEKDKSP